MIPYIETHIVEHCNLNCKGCSHFSGLVKEPILKTLEDYLKDMTQLSKITNKQIEMIRILGGEPLLHPQVVDFCLETRKLFPYSHIVLVSNGILINKISDEDIIHLNHNNIILDISDYGLKLNEEKINKFTYKFHNKDNIKSLYNISLDLTGSQNKNIAFCNCDLVNGGWYFLKEGRLYQCCIMANIDYFCEYFNKTIDFDINDISIDIFTHTEQEILNFLHIPHEVCKYCDTRRRHNNYSPFDISKKEITEWII